ncbi:GHKL domain-containing protein, partial [Butyricicoccus sp. 1XD8-22]
HTVSCAYFRTYTRLVQYLFFKQALGWLTEAAPKGWTYDQKGWRVFTQEGDAVTELTPDGIGGFSDIDFAGQTFYFSRIIEEDLYPDGDGNGSHYGGPTLKLSAANRTFAVFLDGALIYTDSPAQDNRIGSLRLPMLERDRDKPLLVTLPADCAGKTLTIAQSTDPSGGELQEPSSTVWPCDVTLYCGSVYEKSFVSESFRTAVPVTIVYAVGVLLLTLFLWQLFRERPDPGALCGALAAFSFVLGRVSQAKFAYLYFLSLPVAFRILFMDLTMLSLLALLLYRFSGWRRHGMLLITGVLGITTLAELFMNTRLSQPFQLSSLWVLGFLLTLAFAFGEWKRRWFFRIFCSLILAESTVCVLILLFLTSSINFFRATPLRVLSSMVMLASLLSATIDLLHDEFTRWTEARLLLQRNKLTQSSYEAIRRQNEQVMMLRHDMVKHLRLLRQLTRDDKTAAYLDELIGENEKIHSMVQSGNEMVDIILNGKLSAASDAGIAIELVRTQAPETLPLLDTELCSLMMNLLDNALEAAAAPNVKRKYIKLDLHIQNSFFVFSCENSATPDWVTKESAPERGLGLKVVRQVLERHGNLIQTEYDNDYYKTTVLLPLSQTL